MNTLKVPQRLIIFLLIGCAVCLSGLNGTAGETASDDAEGNGPAGSDEMPRYEAEGSFYAGYRFLTRDDSAKAAEYIYPHSSLTFGLSSLACPLPHRYHLNAEYLSRYDFFADTGYAYSDLLLFRNILVGIPHNLDHFNYHLPGEPPNLSYDERNPGDDYFIDYINNHFFLRLKTPEFPLHAFVRHRYIERSGTMQERYVIGDFGQLVKTSRSREIDWQSDSLSLGANSHLGPLELEYEFNRAEFDPGGNNILYDLYPGTTVSVAGSYPHSVVPETESTANWIRMHSSYTGGMVAAATISNLSEKNNYSQTESTTWKGAFDFSWIPDPVLGLFFRYRHRQLDMDTPDRVSAAGLSSFSAFPVRQGISHDKDVFSLSARYKPLSGFSLFSTYSFSHLERKDIDDWQTLRERTDIHSFNLTAHASPLDKLKLKGSYEYSYSDNPAYNIEPDQTNRLRLSATYPVADWLNVYADYFLQITGRDDLRYLNAQPLTVLEEGERDGRSDRLLTSLSFPLSPKLSLSTSWAYNRWKVEQDLAYGLWNESGTGGGLPFIDPGVAYTDESQTFAAACQYLFREDITLTADLSHTLSKGEYRAEDLLADRGFPSSVEINETLFSLGITRRLYRVWELGLKFSTDIYDDSSDELDGTLYVTTVSLRRYF